MFSASGEISIIYFTEMSFLFDIIQTNVHSGTVNMAEEHAKMIFRKFISVLIALIIILVQGMALAENSVSMTISTDKQSYGFGDIMKVTLHVKNDTSDNLSNLTLTNLRPEGTSYVDGSPASKKLTELKAGQAATLITSFRVNSGMPVTGDETPLLEYILLVLLGIGVILFLWLHKGRKGTMLFLLAAGILICAQPVLANAASYSQETSISVMVNHAKTLVAGRIDYEIDDMVLTFKEPEPAHIKHDADSDIWYVNNQFLLVAKKGTPLETVQEQIKPYNGVIVGRLSPTDDYQIEIPEGKTLAELQKIVSSFRRSPFDEAHIHQLWEIDYNSSAKSLSETNFNSTNWGLLAVNAPEAWKYRDEMKTVRVGVWDSRFEQHTNLQFEDIHLNKDNMSISEYNSKISQYRIDKRLDEDLKDYIHGETVSGIICSAINYSNITGGISPNAKLYAFSDSGNIDQRDGIFRYDSVYRIKYGFEWLIKKDKCKVINFSQGVIGTFSEENTKSLDDWITRLLEEDKDNDFLIVQSAGNDGVDAINNGFFVNCQKNRDRIIVVGGCGCNNLYDFGARQTTYLGYSELRLNGLYFDDVFNYGRRVDLVAPGRHVYTTIPQNSFDYFDGTSIATPFVTGTAAMCYGVNSWLKGPEIKQIIMQSTLRKVKDTKADHSILLSYPVLDAGRAVSLALGMALPEDGQGSVSGRLCYRENTWTSDDVKVCPEALVSVFRMNKASLEYVDTFFSNENGYYTCSNLSDGTYMLTFKHPTKVHFGSKMINVVIKNGEPLTGVDAELVFENAPGDVFYPLKGIIFDSSTGQGVPGVRVKLYPCLNNNTLSATHKYVQTLIPDCSSDKDGKFTYSAAIEGGGYTAVFSKEGYQTKYVNVSYGQADELRVEMIPNGYDFEFREQNGKCHVVGYLGNDTQITLPTHDPDGNPVYAVGIELYDEAGYYGNIFNGIKDVTRIVIPEGISRIERAVFSGMNNLKEIDIPNSVTYIGEGAFKNCTGLQSITLSTGMKSVPVSAFEGCTGLKTVILPDSIEKIGEDAFKGCTSLSSVVLGDKTKTIYETAFDGCKSLTEIEFPQTLKEIRTNAFRATALKAVQIPDSVTALGEGAFSSCYSLSEIVLGSGVSRLKNGTFEDCNALTSFAIPSTVSRVDDRVFQGCVQLKEVWVPASVKTLGRDIFYGCYQLKAIYCVKDSPAWKSFSKYMLKNNIPYPVVEWK